MKLGINKDYLRTGLEVLDKALDEVYEKATQVVDDAYSALGNMLDEFDERLNQDEKKADADAGVWPFDKVTTDADAAVKKESDKELLIKWLKNNNYPNTASILETRNPEWGDEYIVERVSYMDVKHPGWRDSVRNKG